jgi:hypothetical protein
MIEIWKNEVLRENPVLVSICSPQIPHELDRDGSWSSAIRGRQINLPSQGES